MRFIIDVFIHTIIGTAVALPLWVKPYLSKVLLAVFLVTSLIDIDHFIVAKSPRIHDAITLKYRPYTHSITFAVVGGFVAFWLTKNPRIGIVIGVGITSHVLRDAIMGITPILWPLRISKLPVWLYVSGEVILFIGCLILRKWV